jgi:phage gpG-like protein
MSVFGFDLTFYVGGAEEPLALRNISVAFERAGTEFAQVGRHFFPLLIPVLEKATRQQFTAKGKGPVAGAWRPLSPGYAAWKRKYYPGKPLLERSGAMKVGLTSSNSGFALRAYGDKDMKFGTAGVTYASFHQTGTAKGLPARPPLDFTGETAEDIRAAALKAARNIVRESRLERYTGGIR